MRFLFPIVLLLGPSVCAQDFLEELELEELVVTADATPPPSRPADFSPQSVHTVPTETLRRNASGTLGETLGWEPGVSSGSFGPGVSRPVIRGFEGVRVRTLSDGLGTFDLSDISPDHGVAVEPFLIESAEVHRGPASLLFGNSAIGGAVDTRSRAIAREKSGSRFSGSWETRYETNGESPSAAAWLSIKEGPFIFRFAGSARESNDIRIPGRARTSDYERIEQPAVYDPATGTQSSVPNPSGRLPNSFHEGSTWSTSLSWLPDHSPLFLALAYSRFDSRYGLPYLYDGDPVDLFGDQSIDLRLDRFDLEGRYEFDHSFFSKVETRLGYGSYRHDEYFRGRGKDSGLDFTETAFGKESVEGRIDLHHHASDERLTGIFGLSFSWEDLSVSRTLSPPPSPFYSSTDLYGKNIGLFALETWRPHAEWEFRLGSRREYVDVTDNSLLSSGFTQGNTGLSSSLSSSATWSRESTRFFDRVALTGILSYVERQPTATERYAFWNNAGIGRFVVGGDLDGSTLHQEKSFGQEIGAELTRGAVTFRLNAFHYDFDNYIFLQEDPSLTGGFGRAVRYVERGATFTGFESSLDWKLLDQDSRQLTLSLMSDFVRGRNTSDEQPLPRMPPWRVGTRLEWQDESLTVGLEVRHAASQDRTQPEPRAELPTDAYTLVNADLSWKLPLPSQNLTLFLRATNLLDQEARLSTSFRKDVAPLNGRSLILGLSQEF